MSANNIRKFVRKHIDFPVRLLGAAAGKIVQCHAKNFGAGGLGMECPLPLETGQQLQVEFSLPHETRILRLNANVRSCDRIAEGKSWRVGLQFINVAVADQIYFTNYMAGTFLLY